MAQLSGITSLAVDGTVYDVSGDVKYELNSVERTSKTSMSGNMNYMEEPVAGSISFTGLFYNNVDPSIFLNMVDVNVSVDTSNGYQVVGNNMIFTGKLEYDAKEGTAAIKFESRDVTILTGA